MIETKTEKPGKKRRLQSSDRATLSKAVLKRVNGWMNQVNEHFNGMIVLKRNDIICTLLEELPEKLSSQLLEKIKAERLTDMQRAKWIFEQLKKAENKGEEIDFDSLVKSAQGSLKRKSKSTKPKARGGLLPTKIEAGSQQKN